MAIGTPVALGSNSLLNTGSTVVITVGTAVSAGDTVIVGGGAASGSGALASVSDSRGNTYTVDVAAAVLKGHGVASSVIGTALQVSDTITLTYTNSVSSARGGWAASVSGLAASPADKTNSNSNTTAAWNGGASGTLTQADEIAFGNGVRTNATTSTPAAGYTELYDFSGSSTSWSAVYQIVSATTTLSPGGTWGGSGSNWAADTVTYKMASGGSTFNDSGSGTLTLSGSGSETQTQAGSGTGALTLSGTGTQSQTHTGSGAATVTFSGTGSESFIPPGGGGTPTPSDGDQTPFFIVTNDH